MQEDISKPKKSLRDIFPETSKPIINPPGPRIDGIGNLSPDVNLNSPQPPISHPRPKSRFAWKIFILIVAVVIVLIAGFGISKYYARVIVNVTPKQGQLVIGGTYQASRDGSTGLKFVLANLEKDQAMTVPATGEKTVSEKARGTIVVYNNFDTNPQKLIINTRFATPQGKIYRLVNAVTVPGGTKDNQGKLVPGQIEAQVIADQAGADYNLERSDFTIPGFKGGPRYDKFYARTKTAILGGLIGKIKIASATDRQAAIEVLKKQLQEKVISDLKAQVPDGYILYDDAILVNYSQATGTAPITGDQAEVKEKATAVGILFSKAELSQYFAKASITDYQDEPVEITNLPSLKFSLQNKSKLDTNKLSTISFNLAGAGLLVWQFSESDLKAMLPQADSGNYQVVFSKFPAIERASIDFLPPWVRWIGSIPEQPDKIDIKINLTATST